MDDDLTLHLLDSRGLEKPAREENAFEYTFRMIKEDMFNRIPNNTPQTQLDLAAAISYSFSIRGLGLA